MGFLLKLGLILLLLAIAGGFIVNRAPALKQKVLEVVNPAAKEARILGELTQNLSALETTLAGSANIKNSADLKAQLGKANQTLARSKDLLGQAVTLNQKNSGLGQAALNKLIDTFIDQTPFPADHLKTDVQANSPLTSCQPR